MYIEDTHSELWSKLVVMIQTAQWTISGGLLCCLYHRSSTWIIIHNAYLLCTSFTAIYCMYKNFLSSNVLYLYDSLLTVNLTKIIWFFNCGLIPAHYNCNYILVLTTLKMATWVAQRCLWLLCDKITFIHSRAFLGLFKKMLYKCHKLWVLYV
jgi:hypothetical protein